MRLTPEKLATWREFAERAGRTLTRFVEEAVDGEIAVQRVIDRNEARERQAAARYHSLDPARARDLDWGRAGEPGGTDFLLDATAPGQEVET
jgi:hypothetical protein